MANKTWTMLARSDGQKLYCKSTPEDRSELSIDWAGPAGAASARFEQLTDWSVHVYTSCCHCKISVYGPGEVPLGEFEYELWD